MPVHSGLFENARWLVGAVARSLRNRGEGVEHALEMLSAQQMDRSQFQQAEPSRLPVLRHFAECTAQTMLLDSGLAAAIASLADHFQWRQSAAYNDRVMGEGFMENYGWSQIIGPHGFFPGSDFLLGFLMMGPHRHYRDHYHPAPELYWLLTGPSEWSRGQQAFASKPAGTTVWHEPNVIHAVRTGEQPLLALWCWTRNTATPAKLVEA